jgi:hypothetical protein
MGVAMFNLDEYTTVRERVIEFWKRYPNGRIQGEILEWSDKRFIVAAHLYRETTDDKPFSTGFANEVITDRGVNKDFALENGFTSAIGVACGHANIGIDKHKPSREEMTKVVAKKAEKPTVAEVQTKPEEQDYWTTPVNDYMKVVDAPVTLEKAMETVSAIIGTPEALEAPSCDHGHMQWKEGEKNGKAWGGYFCNSAISSAHRCPTKWYNLGSDGKFAPQKAWA